MRTLFLTITLLILVAFAGYSFTHPQMPTNKPEAATAIADNSTTTWVNSESKKIIAQANNINPTALKLGLVAYLKLHRQGSDQKEVLTLVDYSKPSNERRLWVIDLKTSRVLFNTWVAHGKNSGELIATSFSNQMNSLKSSLGVYLTESPYFGHDGYSLHIKGLEHNFNDNADRREVVFHGAAYASGAVAKSRGMLGRSWGCMAVGRDTITPLINTIKNNTVVVAYYPDKKWLHTSSYINSSTMA